METIVYFAFFLATLAGAAGVVFTRHAVHSALCLVLTMVALAGIFLLLDAEVIAVFQIIVYAGAIVVLFVFVIMMLNLRHPDQPAPRLKWLRACAAVFGVVMFTIILVCANGVFEIEEGAEAPARTAASFSDIAATMITQYALPFELTSILLLAAMIGAVVIARRKPAPGEEMLQGLDPEEDQIASGQEGKPL